MFDNHTQPAINPRSRAEMSLFGRTGIVFALLCHVMGSTMRRHFIYPVVALPLFATALVGASLAADPTVRTPAPATPHKTAVAAPAAEPKPAAAPDAAKDAGSAEDTVAKDAKDAKSAKNGKKEKKPVVLAKTLFGVVKTPA